MNRKRGQAGDRQQPTSIVDITSLLVEAWGVQLGLTELASGVNPRQSTDLQAFVAAVYGMERSLRSLRELANVVDKLTIAFPTGSVRRPGAELAQLGMAIEALSSTARASWAFQVGIEKLAEETPVDDDDRMEALISGVFAVTRMLSTIARLSDGLGPFYLGSGAVEAA